MVDGDAEVVNSDAEVLDGDSEVNDDDAEIVDDSVVDIGRSVVVGLFLGTHLPRIWSNMAELAHDNIIELSFSPSSSQA